MLIVDHHLHLDLVERNVVIGVDLFFDVHFVVEDSLLAFDLGDEHGRELLSWFGSANVGVLLESL